MTPAEKIQKLRQAMNDHGVQGYLVPRTDEYQGEYVPACAERLAWLTGFTGSAGVAVVLADKAMVMSDGRYTIQLEQQVDKSIYALENSQKIKVEEWLDTHFFSGDVMGYDPRLFTPAQIENIEKAGFILKAVAQNLIDKIWQDQPAPPQGAVSLFPEKYAGRSAAEKITLIQEVLEEQGADAVVLTLPDSMAWLFNIRGGDVAHIPVALSYAIVPREGAASWYINREKVANITVDFADVKSEETFPNDLKKLGNKKVLFDPKRSSIWVKVLLEEGGAAIIAADDPCLMPRACKNDAEQAAMKTAHVRDGAAMVKFLKWFEEEAPSGMLSELSVEMQLEAFRRQAPEFKEPSFSTIAGYGANGAIVHYRATPQTSQAIKPGSLLLLDSGGQYEDGTTDITRTIAVGAVGAARDEMRENYTLVLKGHIALVRAVFNAETTGVVLDALARHFLQERGLDYAHGTGHGVGCYLSVHEEAAMGISPRSEKPLRPGMIISNEPGYYKEGAYGIRIENLVLVRENKNGEFYFETITLAPFDKNLIVIDMLSDEERIWVNEYHARVYDTLSPLLDEETAAWLGQGTQPLS